MAEINAEIEKKKFMQYYQQTIKPNLAPLEQRRKKKLYLFIIMCCSVLIWIGSLCNFRGKGGEILDRYGAVFCFIVLAICLPMLAYYRQSKESILPLIIKYFGDFTYTYKPSLSQLNLQQSCLMNTAQPIITDDGFTGQYDGVPVKIIDYQIKPDNQVAGSPAKPERGIIFFASMNKNFSGQTIVLRNKRFKHGKVNVPNLQSVKLESVEFEKIYNVYANDQIEARYILTVTMMEYMLQLQRVFPKAEFSFYNHNMLIRIRTVENFFECSHFFQTLLNPKTTDKIFTQLYLLFSIIKILQLNQEKLL
ncbi:DUF3137 domain-containing protein [bacterium]|nr:DUF3137 domain-containing protein [bacterium]MBR2274170.1 DUF3137 domain-containing protein [Alphaproteobacteria bacterium]